MNVSASLVAAWLQWGRVLMGPETLVDSDTARYTAALQWGRVLMGPETGSQEVEGRRPGPASMGPGPDGPGDH